MTPVKRLIVNADEFGCAAGINQGVVDAHRRGIVTSASLMVNCHSAAEAAALAKETPGLGVGLCLAFTGGPPISPAKDLPSVVDMQGLLPPTPEGLLKARASDVLTEARAQFRRFRELMGRFPTHFDTRHHAHTVPAVLEAVLALAWETGLPVRSVTPAMRAQLRQEGIPTPDHLVESFRGAEASLEGLLRILGSLEFGTTELTCRPAVVDDELRARSRYAEPRGRELQALANGEVRASIQAAGIRLMHFGGLVST